MIVAAVVGLGMAPAALHIAPAAAALGPLPLPAGGFHDGFYAPIDNLPIGDPGDASVVANGNVALTWAGSTFEGTIDEENKLESFESDIGLTGAITMELAAETAGDLGGTLELASLALPPFEMGTVIVTPYIGVNLRLSGHAGAQISMVAPFDIGTAFSKSDTAANAHTTTTPTFLPEVGLPDLANALSFDATVTVELSTTFLVSISGIPIGGPVLATSLGVELDVDLRDQPWWDLNGLAELKYGWSMPDLLGQPKPPRRMPTLVPLSRWNIAEAEDEPPTADVSTRWARAFDIFNQDHAGAVLPIGDELVVVENDSSPWMTTLDGLGNPTWQQTDDPASGSQGRQAVARTADGSLLVAGEHGSGDLRVGRFAADGTPEWSKGIHVTDATSADWSSITPTADGAIISGNVRRGTSALDRPTLVALDDAGELQWATEIDPGAGSGDATIVEVVETPSGELLAVGKVDYELPDRSIDQWNALIMRLDPDGTPMASFVFGGPYLDVVSGVAVQPDGSYAISGQTLVTPRASTESWVASFDADDNLLWSSTYADRVDAGYATATGITAVPGGDYVVSGTTGMTDKDGWLIRLNSSGMPMWSKSYVGDDEDELVGVVAMDEGVAAFGHTQTTNPVGNGFHDLWLMRTNVDGMVHFDADSGFDTVNGAVQWTPTSVHVQLPLVPLAVPTTVTVTDGPTAVNPASATNSLLTD